MTTEDGDEQTDIEFLSERVVYHNMVWIQQLLKGKGLSAKGNKPELRDRVEVYLDDGSLSPSRTSSICWTKVEGWGISTFIFTWLPTPELPLVRRQAS